MTLGRIFRLDTKLRQDRSSRWGLTVLFNVAAGFLFVFVAVEGCRPGGDRFPMIPAGILWLALAVGVELLLRWIQSFELKLLPDGVQITKWDRTVTMIEPQIIGGRYLAWSDKITLGCGSNRVTIGLNWFHHPRDRAAIVAHCSQFLSPQQQADFGREWAAIYYRLITPPKPASPRRLALTCLISFLAGGAVLVAVIEYFSWLHPDLRLENGLPLRFTYLGWLVFTVLFTGLLLTGPRNAKKEVNDIGSVLDDRANAIAITGSGEQRGSSEGD